MIGQSKRLYCSQLKYNNKYRSDKWCYKAWNLKYLLVLYPKAKVKFWVVQEKPCFVPFMMHFFSFLGDKYHKKTLKHLQSKYDRKKKSQHLLKLLKKI